ncbi:unnamed protein product [Diamesa serratosioi]
MASLFDQFNNNSLLKSDLSARNVEEPANMNLSGYVSIQVKEKMDIFTKQKMNLNLPANISHLCIANDWLVILMNNHMIFRLNLKQPDRQSEVLIEKHITGCKISGMFLDPLGSHLLLAISPKSSGYNSELMYLNKNSNKPKIITKFKDHEVTAVAFNYENISEQSTGNILLGTSKGLIFEADLGSDGDKLIQNNWKQVFDIGRGENSPATGIAFYRAPGTNNFIVLISTIDRLYKFHEVLRVIDDKVQPLQNIFNSYLNVPEEAKDYEQVSSKLNYSRLEFIHENRFPRAFGWLTENGIFYGELNQIADSPNFVTTRKTMAYPDQPTDLYKTSSYISKTYQHNAPLSFILTDFHLLLQYSDHVTGISLINHEVIYDEYFPDQYGKLMSIVKDTRNGNVYTFSNKTIFRYKICNEQRNVWRMYLDNNNFELAEKYSRDNPANLDLVLSRIGEDLYEKKRYKESAEVYSKTKKSFEEITLKFLKINQNLPLIYYLKSRLAELNGSMDKTQITMLVIWLVELYLTEMNRSSADSLNRQKEFDEFMNQATVQTCLKDNRKVIYDLIASHGDSYNLTALTTLNEDYEQVISQYIQDSCFADALSMLKLQRRADLFYKFCPILIEELPKETVQLLIERGKSLKAAKLLPTLLSLNSDVHRVEIVKYLEFAIHSLGKPEQSIHNYLIQIYAKYKENEKLMTYFETQGKDISLIHYDVHYALRICQSLKIKEACVFLLCILELWQQAVELALTFDTKLAQQTASQPGDRDLKRKLWLIIAEHEISGKEDVKEALELLKICDLLRIEDLLPFFSDFQKIDHFKSAICDSLKDYNQKIQEQRKEMEDSAEAADNVRKSLQTFRNRSVTISAQDKCSLCGYYLLMKPFFLFPCSHKFHADCLEKNLIQLLTPEEGKKLLMLKQKLAILNTQVELSNNQNNVIPLQQTTRDQLKLDIENILAAECTFCGTLMIQQLDAEFDDQWNNF